MKRSRSIRLVLLGGLSAGLASGCGGKASAGPGATLSAENVYTNDFQVPGVGYYHAPYRAWYPLPYNHLDPQTGRYFHGGTWSATPHASITNLSSPSDAALRAAQAARTDVRRGGFGTTTRSTPFFS